MDKIIKKMASRTLSGCLLALSASAAYSGAMGPEAVSSSGIYVGVFGGGGRVSSTDISQFGTAFYTEAEGGPLAVNGFGTTGSNSVGIIGGHIGYEWLNNIGTFLPVTPAVELEGYYIGKTTLEGHDLNNDTTRLPEHDFLVGYPLKSGVFLVNAILNVNKSTFGKFRPYVGVGLGSAVVSVSGATATQLSPAEPGINHYNSGNDARAVTFAAQPKIGLHYDLSPRSSLFVEYRFLYLSQTNFTFGSTVYPGHPATAPWLVTLKPQNYNLGTVGIEFDV